MQLHPLNSRYLKLLLEFQEHFSVCGMYQRNIGWQTIYWELHSVFRFVFLTSSCPMQCFFKLQNLCELLFRTNFILFLFFNIKILYFSTNILTVLLIVFWLFSLLYQSFLSFNTLLFFYSGTISSLLIECTPQQPLLVVVSC